MVPDLDPRDPLATRWVTGGCPVTICGERMTAKEAYARGLASYDFRHESFAIFPSVVVRRLTTAQQEQST
jgi:hypothetical protein